MTCAIILAGGLGTRLRSTVPELPKPMAPINGRPFLEHQLNFWIGQGIKRAILSVGYRHDAIMSHFGNNYRGIAVDYAIEEGPLGTGGGLLLALKKVPDAQPFLVLNGDSFVECSLANLVHAHIRQQSDWTMVIFKADKPDRYAAIDINTQGQISGLSSGKADTGQWANAGVYLISPNVFASGEWQAGHAVSLEQDLLPAIVASGKRCFTTPCDGVFIDIGVPEDYVRAAKLSVFQ